jgi:hypothetical protein
MQWFIPLMPATWEVVIRRIVGQWYSGKKFRKISSQQKAPRMVSYVNYTTYAEELVRRSWFRLTRPKKH